MWYRSRASVEPRQQKYKRLKQGHRDEERDTQRRGLAAEIFSDDDDEVDEERHYPRASHRAPADEFEGFIEDDYSEDDEERAQRQEDMEVARPRDKALTMLDTSGLDKDALDDMEAIFGDGEYDWALEKEEEDEDREREDQTIELKDVFEPSQLKEKLLTEEDNEIRSTDQPERFQLDRKPFKDLVVDPEQFKEEVRWITNLMWPQKQLSIDLQPHFQKAINKVLEFFTADDVEVPFVFQVRRDYLIHPRRSRSGAHSMPEVEKLLNQDDLWRVLELDLKFRSLLQKRNALEKAYDALKTHADIQDDVLEQMIPVAATMEEVQDLQDYLNFQYSIELRELQSLGNVTGREVKRPAAKSASHERVRKSPVYEFVRVIGVSPDRLARNALRNDRKASSEDDSRLPMDLADSLTGADFATGDQVLHAARQMYAEELYMSPRMRKHFRAHYYQTGLMRCRRTDKGLRRIDESHPYYEIKYLINQTMADMAQAPELFLKMMKAEEDGLVEVRLTLEHEREFRRQLYAEFASDNFSDLADKWNAERQKVLDMAFSKLERVIVKGVKESLRTACQEELLKTCREEYLNRLDQQPKIPEGLAPGTIPRVLALSNGGAELHRDPVCWAWVEEDGRVLEHGKFMNMVRDENQRDAFAELVRTKRPDVIGISGWSVDTHRLVREVETIISEKGLMGPEYDDDKTNEVRSDLLTVVVVNDEVARLYKDSARGVKDHPTLHPQFRYCIALAKYLQNPLKEYAALGKDVASLLIHPYQQYLPQDKLLKYLETAMVDVVNLCGVDLNDAVSNPYTANLLPYISGLGPRKATSLLKGINANGGVVMSRDELVGDPARHKVAVLGPQVWNNCASFLYIEYDHSNPESDPLDNTRIHPEDYDLARKVAADALGLDEEDVKAETDENGRSAVVRKLFREDEQDKVNELVLEEYAEQLEIKFSQRKRATLETIRAELTGPFEEIRKKFTTLKPEQIFTMLTGETSESLCEEMLVPVNVRVVRDDFAIVKLDCGIEGRIEAHEISHRNSLKELLQVGQIARAKVLDINRRDFTAKLTMREDLLRIPYRPRNMPSHKHWDFRLEDDDKEELREKDKTTGRTQRVINHPLFKPFNSTQAEEYLGGQAPGDAVIRPSSKGNDHLAVTWKVADGVYQHIDVLELQKENEFSVGKTLRVGGKYTYSDLDELMVDHVKATARKVGEMMRHDKFQLGSRTELGEFIAHVMDGETTADSRRKMVDDVHGR